MGNEDGQDRAGHSGHISVAEAMAARVTPFSREPFSELCRKALLLVETDAFALSHFRPLIVVLREVAREVVVLARDTGRLAEVEALGARVIAFDFAPSPDRPARQAAASAWALARIIEAEGPDVLHAIGLRPAVLSALALKLVSVPHAMLHLTGLGALRIAEDRRGRFYRRAALRLLATVLRQPSSYLLVENLDDLAMVRETADPGGRFAILGGSGVDQQSVAVCPVPTHPVPVACYIGRMVRAKGADIFMQAIELLERDKLPLRALMCGRCDPADPDSLAASEVEAWSARVGAVWREHVEDIAEVWRNADMFVLPARGGEGLPRAMLEAAASQRPMVVSNVPGCRDFVRHGVEGLLVPPGDSQALAQGMARLAGDAALRVRMGEAARLRLLHGFTEAHVMQALREAYASMLPQRG